MGDAGDRAAAPRSRAGTRLTVAEVDVWQIGSDDRGLVLRALGEGLQLPFVILGGSLVCAGMLDISAIVTAVGESVQV